MIRCTLIKIGRNQRGLPIRSEQPIRGDSLSIGRAPECNIHLPDHRVGLHHAEISLGEDGRLYIESRHAPINVNGDFVQQSPLSAGMQLLIGPYRLQVEALPQADIPVLSYELIVAPEEASTAASRLPLPSPPAWLTLRRLSWLLATLIVTGLIALPVAQALWPALGKQLEQAAFNPQKVWITGQLSNAHRRSNAKCMDCHNLPFQKVSNAACLKCHDTMQGHGRHLKASQGIDRHACISCHSEHQGMHADTNISQLECVSCHGDIRRHDEKSKLENIGDFVTSHPDFRLSIRTGIRQEDVRRVLQNPQEKPPREKVALKFSHEAHLGEVSIPWDTFDTRTLNCASCHRGDAAGERFQTISFKQDCQFCHQDRLEFDPPVEGRKLLHEKPSELDHLLRDYYAGIALQQKKPASWVAPQLEKASRALASDEGCAYCHVLQTSPEQPLGFSVAPMLQLDQPWFPEARFSHSAHRSAKCTSCHKVEKATDSAEIHIPDRQSCLKCHSGNQPAKNKIGSSCNSCHQFHTAKRLLPK